MQHEKFPSVLLHLNLHIQFRFLCLNKLHSVFKNVLLSIFTTSFIFALARLHNSYTVIIKRFGLHIPMEQKRTNDQKRVLSKHLLFLVALALVVLSFMLPFVSADWPTFHNTNNHTGFSEGTFDLTDFGQLWNFTTGFAIEGSPTVVNGVVYIATYDNRTYALNAIDGSVIWNVSTLNV